MKDIKPMKAARATQATIEKLMVDPDWVAETKYNGWRYEFSFGEDKVSVTSRRNSVKTGEKSEKGECIPHLSKPVRSMIGTVLDGEIVTKAEDCNSTHIASVMGASPDKALAYQEEHGYYHFKCYDILAYKGKDIQNLPMFMRATYRKRAIADWNNSYAHFVTSTKDKEGLLHHAWEKGLEGIVLKNLKAVYVQDSRDPETWVKVKKKNKDPYDVVICGYEDPDRWTYRKHPDNTSEGGPVMLKGKDGFWYRCENRNYQNGWIKSIKYGCYKKGKLVEIGTVSGMSDEVRGLLSKNGKKYIGTVIEVDGQEIYKDAIIHPRFKAFKHAEEKDPTDCTYEDLFGKRTTTYE